MSRFQRSLFIFRRDLRVDDNTALINALQSSVEVIPCFIFDPRQKEDNRYFSQNAFQFMVESLKDLRSQLKKRNGDLHIFYGKAHDVVERVIEEQQVDAVFVNRDYTPFSKKRDVLVEKVCNRHNAVFFQSPDVLLNEPEDVITKSGKHYSVFTPFFKASSKLPVEFPSMMDSGNFFKGVIGGEDKGILDKMLSRDNSNIYLHGGRENALKILENLDMFDNYHEERDYPSLDATTGLSAHNKFGTISIREVYHAIVEELGLHHPLVAQLYWRDFFTHLAYNDPHVFGHPFRKKYESMEWENDRKKFSRWCGGMTGFPIVDAGMRQLNSTGYMHNRVRMIVASFLVKDLHIDWRWGERYFASKLVDYDPCVNNGNWQWAASTGADSQPYFRIFNPWLQQKKFDKDCEYIKKWIPELADVEPRYIHKPDKDGGVEVPNYPEPIVEHSKEREISLFMFRSASQVTDI
ncbi:deoxyribodipyrimidine photo-lyase [Methanococcoides sp. AM1]|uniref:cryptochrome/photolyase family protein n=1 Tax=Methanococcoides sp. AM1 TaxID=1201011 RepID=UPI001082ADA0|nr:deoxyribodipyrimidine photo-lyase [Methanococcoides sp. AM1]